MTSTTTTSCAFAVALLLAGCATKPTAPATAPAAAAAPAQATAPTPNPRAVKSRNGQFDGEMIGTPAAASKFAKLKIGMTLREVNALIGTPNDLARHETGKRWIPFYLGNDAQRLQALYQGEGCLTYTGGNVFGAGDNELIRVYTDTSGRCWQN